VLRQKSLSIENAEAPGSRGALLVGREVERSETSDDHECTRDAKRRLTRAHIADT